MTFDEIIDIALVKVDDYKDNEGYNQSQDVFKQYCDDFDQMQYLISFSRKHLLIIM